MISNGGIVRGKGEAAQVADGRCRADPGGVARVGAGAFRGFGWSGQRLAPGVAQTRPQPG
jgi:hypothetical protein